MQNAPKYRFFKGTDGVERIMSFKIPKGDTEYRKLNTLLTEHFPGSESGTMYDERALGHDVIVFENAEDCSAFALTYGHIYGTNSV